MLPSVVNVSNYREAGFRALTVAGALFLALLFAETLLRLFPLWLPAWYRAGFPVSGIELFYPGVLARTPIEGVPLPYRADRDREMVGRVPRDLEWKGLVAPGDNPDHDLYSDIRFRIDRYGFPNASEMTNADLLLVGDSFAVAAGVLSPEGFQVGLARRLGLTVFNLGIPAIGPAQEEWLLAEVGLTLEPRGVVWLFFGGNDIADSEALADLKNEGVRSYEDRFAGFSPPTSYLLDLTRKSFARKEEDASKPHSLPGFAFETRKGVSWPLWFNPSYLEALTRDRESWQESAGWKEVEEIFSRVSTELAKRDVRLLVVYVPSKAQVYLPHVEKDPALVLETANFGKRDRRTENPEDFLRQAMQNRDSVEHLLRTLCAGQGIQFLSLKSTLDALAADGELGFLSADTHWNEHGQRAAIEPVALWWNSEEPALDRTSDWD